jgi:hypothetical protein
VFALGEEQLAIQEMVKKLSLTAGDGMKRSFFLLKPSSELQSWVWAAFMSKMIWVVQT